MASQTDTSPATARSGLPALRACALGFIAAALLAAGPALSQSDPVVAKVNGMEIRESDLTMAEEDVGQNPQTQQLTGDAKRDYLVSYVADVMLVAKAAEGKKVGDQKEFKSRLAFIRNKLLMETLLQQEGKAALTDAAMKKVYDDAVKQMGAEQEVRARHILVPTEDEAKAVLAEIKKGTDFAELAKQKSKDPGAAAEGGDLGYFGKEQMVPEFAETAFKMDKGQVSDPVKTQFGWHIIKVEDKRTKPVPEFTQVKEQVETYVVRKAQADYIHKLQEGADIERLDKK
ncbi:MAG: peptidylprolyl isomerase [Xanthobacteraceae bacterium]|nr:peptidylprolyl isomerase [Xanthobacteraceae bacterium]